MTRDYEIRELRRQIQQLEKERDEWKHQAESNAECHDESEAECQKLRDEIEKLQRARDVQDVALAYLRNDLRECAIRAERDAWQLSCRNAERARDEAIAHRDKVEAERDALVEQLNSVTSMAERFGQERDALRADALRYRWLRERECWIHDPEGEKVAIAATGYGLDAAIDAVQG